MMNGIERLAEDFFANKNVCVEPRNLKVGDKCFIIDINIIDEETDFYAIIPVIVARVDISNRIPGRAYYYFVAYGSKNDEQMNNTEETFQNGETLRYYTYLENTSPYILLSNPADDIQ